MPKVSRRSRTFGPWIPPKTRKFGGKQFVFFTKHETKRSADSQAASTRRGGHNARVVKRPKGQSGSTAKYAVYTRRGR